MPRDWCATVGFDRATGIGWAGGYVGVGVSTSNLSGRTLADLVTGRDSPLVTLPWVGRRVRPWEPEPARWLGVTGMYALLNATTVVEQAIGFFGVLLRRNTLVVFMCLELMLVASTLALVAACWLWAGRMLRLPEEQRVFTR